MILSPAPSVLCFLCLVVAIQLPELRLGEIKDGRGVSEGIWTAVAERSGDTALEREKRNRTFQPSRADESGVALRFPPQSISP